MDSRPALRFVVQPHGRAISVLFHGVMFSGDTRAITLAEARAARDALDAAIQQAEAQQAPASHTRRASDAATISGGA